MANTWSKNSRRNGKKEELISNEKEILFGYCKDQQKLNTVDYYIFGHRHLPLELKLDERAKYINLGEWINYNTYGVFDCDQFELKEFKG